MLYWDEIEATRERLLNAIRITYSSFERFAAENIDFGKDKYREYRDRQEIVLKILKSYASTSFLLLWAEHLLRPPHRFVVLYIARDFGFFGVAKVNLRNAP